ncbi:hypothetical protein K469DRAFT_797885, partial [Zopfia rhizophila CBS 207.26]
AESSLIRARHLAKRVRENIRQMPSPCSRCRDNGRRYLVHLSSGRCSECINRNVKCDLVVTQPEWNRLDHDKERLYHQLEKAQDDLLTHRRHEKELRSRERQIRRELAQTDSQEREMFQRELASIDEVHAIEEEEQSHQDQPNTP